MFDNRFDLWQPGQLIRFGLPWHGLAVKDSNAPAAPWTLTLPTGRTLQVPGPLNLIRHSHGASIAYRDPRAIDVPPTDEDIAAGAQWRGTALLPNRRLGTDLAYFDGETTWRLSLGSLGASVSHRPVLTVGAASEDSSTPISTSVVSLDPAPDFSGLPGYFEYSNGFRAWKVLDATLTGDKLLVSRDWGPQPNDQAVSTGHLRQCMELWEYTLTGTPGVDLVVTRRLLWSLLDTLGSAQNIDTHPAGTPFMRVKAQVYWVKGASTANGTGIETRLFWESDDTTNANLADYEAPHRHRRYRALTGRVVGAYYSPAGEVRLQTVDLTAETIREVLSVTGPALVSDQPGTGHVEKWRGTTEYWWSNLDVLTQPDYLIQVSMTVSLESTMELVLRDNGVEVSRFTARETGVYSRESELRPATLTSNMQARDFDLGGVPFDPSETAGHWHNSNSSVSATQSYSGTYKLDGVQTRTTERTDEYNTWVQIGYSGFVGNWPTSIVALFPEISVPGGTETARPAAYNTSMPVLTCISSYTGQPALRHQRFGAIACRGQSLPGMHNHIGDSAVSLLGAHNAVTGEWVRDTPTPCMYL